MESRSPFSVAVLLAAGLAAGCAGGSSSSAPPGAATAGAHHPGQFVWQDLVTDDVAAARAFYGALLGWEFENTSRRGKPYVLILEGGEHVGGIVYVERDDPAQPIAQWLSYVSVSDVDRSVAEAEKAGSKVLVEPLELDGAARVAVIADPQGAALGLARLAKGDPAETTQPPLGRFFWREYLARNDDEALSFYADLLDYQSEEIEPLSDVDLTYHALRRERTRAGLFQIPAGNDEVAPNWLPYVRVEDPGALADRVAGLGGRVILAPEPGIRKGTLAIVADPSGAALALQKWPL